MVTGGAVVLYVNQISSCEQIEISVKAIGFSQPAAWRSNIRRCLHPEAFPIWVGTIPLKRKLTIPITTREQIQKDKIRQHPYKVYLASAGRLAARREWKAIMLKPKWGFYIFFKSCRHNLILSVSIQFLMLATHRIKAAQFALWAIWQWSSICCWWMEDVPVKVGRDQEERGAGF